MLLTNETSFDAIKNYSIVIGGCSEYLFDADWHIYVEQILPQLSSNRLVIKFTQERTSIIYKFHS